MGRPWWYDSYWEKKGRQRKRRFFLPKGPLLSWLIVLAMALLLTLWRPFK